MFRERNDTKQIQIYRTKCFNVCEFCFVPSLDPDFDFCVFFADVIPAPIIMVMVDNVHILYERDVFASKGEDMGPRHS